jgi:hypothetical protein
MRLAMRLGKIAGVSIDLTRRQVQLGRIDAQRLDHGDTTSPPTTTSRHPKPHHLR